MLDLLMVRDEYGVAACRTIGGVSVRGRFSPAIGKHNEVVVPLADKYYLSCCPRLGALTH